MSKVAELLTSERSWSFSAHVSDWLLLATMRRLLFYDVCKAREVQVPLPSDLVSSGTLPLVKIVEAT